MRNLFLILLLALVVPARAEIIITASITATNKTTNGATLTINGSTRTFTNDVTTSPDTLILTNATAGAVATNVYNSLSKAPFSSAHYLSPKSSTATNVVRLMGAVGELLTVSLSGNWGTVSYTTGTVANPNTFPLVLPLSTMAATNQTNVASMLVDVFAKSTNAVPTNSPAFVKYADLSSVQSLTGKVLRSSSQIGGSSTNVEFKRLWTRNSPLETNGLGFAASNGFITTFIVPDANGYPLLVQTSDGDAAEPSDPAHILTLKWAQAVFPQYFTTNYWLGSNIFNGPVILAGGSVQTAPTLLSPYDTNGLHASGIYSNSSSVGRFNLSGDFASVRSDYSSLANGNNFAVPFGTNHFVRISGTLTADAALCGIANGRDGLQYLLYNDTLFNITLSQNSVDPTPANRIVNWNGSDLVLVPQGWARMIYDSNASRWKTTALHPTVTNSIARVLNVSTNYTASQADSGTTFWNAGQATTITSTIPTAVSVGWNATWLNQTNKIIYITASNAFIRVGASVVSTNNGYIIQSGAAAGSAVSLTKVSTNEFWATTSTGTWTGQ